MKFIIQTVNSRIAHDFTFQLVEAIKYQEWYSNIKIPFIYSDTWSAGDKSLCPVGTVEFVSSFLSFYYGITPKPINVPRCLFEFAGRKLFNGTDFDIPLEGVYFIKSADMIKSSANGFSGTSAVLKGNYQISEVIDIESEWRAFVYEGKLVGLQNYLGDFRIMPEISFIDRAIRAYSDAPIAYTIDVGINKKGTFVIECHDFFSCGLYGFRDNRILPQMFWRVFQDILRKIKGGWAQAEII